MSNIIFARICWREASELFAALVTDPWTQADLRDIGGCVSLLKTDITGSEEATVDLCVSCLVLVERAVCHL